jgi:hypothetical protein
MAGRRSESASRTKQREVGVKQGLTRRRGNGHVADANLPLLRTSERGSMKGCEFRWDIEFNSLRKPQVASPALRFGVLVHQALAGWYVPGVKRGRNPVDGFAAAYRAELKLVKELFGAKVQVGEDDVWVDALDLGTAMLENYMEEYGEDEEWEVLTTEQPFRVIVRKPDTQDPWFWYVGILDGIWRNRLTREVWIPDHKTTAGIGGTKKHPSIPKHLHVDDQASAYWSYGVEWARANGYLKPKQKLSGMMYNYLRKALPDERKSRLINGERIYLNLDGNVSKRQPAPYFARIPIMRDEYDREESKKRAMRDYRRIELLRSGEIDVLKSPGQMNCGWCWARDICELHETGNDFKSFAMQTTQKWDPYAEHEIEAGEQD